MPDSASTGSPKFELKLASAALPVNDARWRTQVDGLLADLKNGGGDVRREVTPVAGTKGGMETIILALGSSGAIAAAVKAFGMWLARPGGRSATITYEEEGGKKITKTITAENVTESAFVEMFKGAGKRA